MLTDPSAGLPIQQLFTTVLENYPDGVLLLTEEGTVLKATDRAWQFCQELTDAHQPTASLKLPEEIWQICRLLVEPTLIDPPLADADLPLSDGRILRVRVQWLNLPGAGRQQRYLLVMLEDSEQAIESAVIMAVQKYQLTPGERRVWQLRLRNYSYGEIASRLYITENTVKKHVKNILAKRRAVIDRQAS